MKISVIMITYNRAKLMPVMLNCLKNQTLANYEFVLVNNGSTDETARICEDFAKANSNVNLVTIKENIGASHGRNIGLKSANGDYITFVDDDDFCKPNMLEFLVNIAQNENADIAMCGAYNDFDDRLEPYFISDLPYSLNRLDGLRELLNRRLYNVAPPTKLFKKDLWNGLEFPADVLVDDIHVVYKVFERAQKVAGLNEPLYHFKKHDSNMTSFIHNRTITANLLDEYLEMYKARAEYLLKRAPEIAKDIENSMVAFMQSMCEIIIKNDLKDCESQLKFMQNYLA